jgi:hypothetical protein
MRCVLSGLGGRRGGLPRDGKPTKQNDYVITDPRTRPPASTDATARQPRVDPAAGSREDHGPGLETTVERRDVLREDEGRKHDIAAVAEDVRAGRRCECLSTEIPVFPCAPRDTAIGGDVGRRGPAGIDAYPADERCHVLAPRRVMRVLCCSGPRTTGNSRGPHHAGVRAVPARRRLRSSLSTRVSACALHFGRQISGRRSAGSRAERTCVFLPPGG